MDVQKRIELHNELPRLYVRGNVDELASQSSSFSVGAVTLPLDVLHLIVAFVVDPTWTQGKWEMRGNVGIVVPNFDGDNEEDESPMWYPPLGESLCRTTIAVPGLARVNKFLHALCMRRIWRHHPREVTVFARDNKIRLLHYAPHITKIDVYFRDLEYEPEVQHQGDMDVFQVLLLGTKSLSHAFPNLQHIGITPLFQEPDFASYSSSYDVYDYDPAGIATYTNRISALGETRPNLSISCYQCCLPEQLDGIEIVSLHQCPNVFNANLEALKTSAIKSFRIGTFGYDDHQRCNNFDNSALSCLPSTIEELSLDCVPRLRFTGQMRPVFPRSLRVLHLSGMILAENHMRNCFHEGFKYLDIEFSTLDGDWTPPKLIDDFDVTGLPSSLEHLKIDIPITGTFPRDSQLRKFEYGCEYSHDVLKNLNLVMLPTTLEELHVWSGLSEVIGSLARFPKLFQVVAPEDALRLLRLTSTSDKIEFLSVEEFNDAARESNGRFWKPCQEHGYSECSCP